MRSLHLLSACYQVASTACSAQFVRSVPPHAFCKLHGMKPACMHVHAHRSLSVGSFRDGYETEFPIHIATFAFEERTCWWRMKLWRDFDGTGVRRPPRQRRAAGVSSVRHPRGSRLLPHPPAPSVPPHPPRPPPEASLAQRPHPPAASSVRLPPRRQQLRAGCSARHPRPARLLVLHPLRPERLAPRPRPRQQAAA